jgi:hypothetical protein
MKKARKKDKEMSTIKTMSSKEMKTKRRSNKLIGLLKWNKHRSI